MQFKSIFVWCLLLIPFVTMGAQTAETYETFSGSIKRTRVVCTQSANSLDLGEGVLGMSLSAGGGVWDEVDPNNLDSIIDGDRSNMFLPISRFPGEYTFLFTAKNNPCMPDDSTALARVIILDQILNSTEFLPLCENEAATINLPDYLSPYLADVDVDYYEYGFTTPIAGGQFDIPGDFEGELRFSFQINDTSYICDSVAYFTLTVQRVSDASDLPTAGATELCVNTMTNVVVDLNRVLGVSPLGTWAPVATGTEQGPANVGELVSLDDYVPSTLPAVLNYEFTPSSTCLTGYKPVVSITITDDLTTNLQQNVEIDLCKTFSPTGYVSLLELLDLTIPGDVGVWSMDLEASPVDVHDGVFDLYDARVGKYTYTYKVSNAVELCGLTDMSAQVTLNIFDISEVKDGQAQTCVGATGSTDLSAFIDGLPTTGVTWYDGMDTARTAALPSSTITLTDLAVGTHAYTYAYPAGPCGLATGHMYLTVTDVLTNFRDVEEKFCLTDLGADKINLERMLGVVGIPGTWEAPANVNAADWNDPIFNGKEAGTGVYEFKFVVDPSYDGCIEGGSEAVVRIIMTDDLTN